MKIAYALACLFIASTTQAQSLNTPEAEAKWLLERLTGVKWPASSAPYAQVLEKVRAGQKQEAAEIATQQAQFINVTVREFAAKMSTRDESVREQLNDFTATVMGVTRDNTDARHLLYGNFLYKGDQARLTGLNITDDVHRNNNHYAQMVQNSVNLKDALIRVDGQRLATGPVPTPPVTVPPTPPDVTAALVANPDPAGILTSRAWISSHAIAGTNRRLVEYTFRQFMCVSMAEWADTASFDTRVGRDIDRAPGGDPQRYLTTCKGCHTGMDGFRGAFARWDYRDQGNGLGVAAHSQSGATDNNYRAPADANQVVNKMNVNNTVYPGGFAVTNDSFVNYTDRLNSQNALNFGWRTPAPDSDPVLSSRTTGVHAFGRLIAGSRRFNQCMAKRVWDSVCKHELSEAEMDAVYVSLGMQFESSLNFNLRKLFEAVAIHPKCRLAGGA